VRCPGAAGGIGRSVDRSGVGDFGDRCVTYAVCVTIDNQRVAVIPVLSLLEVRVLGVLVEKERTFPTALTLNALVAGCNQKTSRDPVLNAAEADVRAAVARAETPARKTLRRTRHK
jgi:hypothetical protein